MANWLALKWAGFTSNKFINTAKSRVESIDGVAAAGVRALIPGVTFGFRSEEVADIINIAESPLKHAPADAYQPLIKVATIRDQKGKLRKQSRQRAAATIASPAEQDLAELLFSADMLAIDVMLATVAVSILPRRAADMEQTWERLAAASDHLESAMNLLEAANEVVSFATGVQYAPAVDLFVMTGRDRWIDSCRWMPDFT